MTDTVILGIIGFLWFIFGFSLGVYWRARKQNNTRYAGDIQVYESEGTQVYSLNLNCEPEDLLAQDKVIFHIVGNRA